MPNKNLEVGGRGITDKELTQKVGQRFAKTVDRKRYDYEWEAIFPLVLVRYARWIERAKYEREQKWFDDAREYVAGHKQLDPLSKANYMLLLNHSNADCWHDFIEDDYTPPEAIDEDLSYCD